MIKRFVAVILTVAALAVAGQFSPVYAACDSAASCINTGVNSVDNPSSAKSTGDIIRTVVNILLFALGAAAVVMIVIGGIKYVTSQGDSNGVSSAKNTILYAVIGLIVAISAYAIVNWVIKAFI